jgi:hypothetical protein
MMLDADVVAVSPSSVYRVLSEAGLLMRWARRASKKGTGFVQPAKPHEHWYVDIAYLKDGRDLLLPLQRVGRLLSCDCALGGEGVDDGAACLPAGREVELVLQRAREKYQHEHPRIISDNSPQFIARDLYVVSV